MGLAAGRKVGRRLPDPRVGCLPQRKCVKGSEDPTGHRETVLNSRPLNQTLLFSVNSLITCFSKDRPDFLSFFFFFTYLNSIIETPDSIQIVFAHKLNPILTVSGHVNRLPCFLLFVIFTSLNYYNIVVKRFIYIFS